MKISNLLLVTSVAISTIVPLAPVSQAHHLPQPIIDITPDRSAPIQGVGSSSPLPTPIKGKNIGNARQQKLQIEGSGNSPVRPQQPNNGRKTN
jgi:hypothetical protein